MSQPTRMMIALFATLALAGVAESYFMPPGPAPHHLARAVAPAPSTGWLASLR